MDLQICWPVREMETKMWKKWKYSLMIDFFPFSLAACVNNLMTRKIFRPLYSAEECHVRKGKLSLYHCVLIFLDFSYKEIILIKSLFCSTRGTGWVMLSFGWNWIWEKILTWNNTRLCIILCCWTLSSGLQFLAQVSWSPRVLPVNPQRYCTLSEAK